MAGSTSEILPGLWRFETLHPEWTPQDGGAEGWEQSVAWWASPRRSRWRPRRA